MENLQGIIDGLLMSPDAHMFPRDLELFKKTEITATAYSLAVRNPDEHSQPLYSRETVEALLEANRKQVLLEAEARVRRFITHPNANNEMVKAFNAAWSDAADELRRMALEPTGVDKGEGNE
jgi:hypothetical protein